MAKLCREILSKALVTLGLSEVDAEVYVFLAVEGPQKGRNIAEVLQIEKHQLYSCLKALEIKGIVNCTRKRITLYTAVSPENVVDILVKSNLEDAQQMEENREKILSFWQSLIKRNSTQ